MASSGTINGVRPQFEKKLAKTIAASITTYTAPDISGTYDETEVQAIADALETLIAELKAIS